MHDINSGFPFQEILTVDKVLPQQRVFIGDGDKDGLNKEPGRARVESSHSASQQRLGLRLLDWGEKPDSSHVAPLALR